jgi:hypothetical protein
MPRGPTTATIKVLFAQSHNTCAAPGCENPVVAPATPFDRAAVLAHVAHIVPRSDRGPRGDPSFPAELRHEGSNLLLLCAHHHMLVDAQDSTYSAEELRRWKRDALAPPDELVRIEDRNRDWVVRTGSFHFNRLLHAIEEVEQPAGRLEAARAFNAALHSTGAMRHPNGPNLLRVCEELHANELFQLDWRLRRMLARVVGDVLGLHLGEEHASLIRSFAEARLETRGGQLLLAEAAVEHTRAAAAIGAPVLRRLLLSAQPQVAWQLLRRWPLVSPAMPDGLEPDEVLSVDSLATRRMLILTQLHEARTSSRATTRLLAAARSARAGEPEDSPEARFADALSSWAMLHTSADLGTSAASRKRIVRIDQLLHAGRPAKGGALNTLVGPALELDSIERDMRNASGDYQSHPQARFSEGRYGYTRHYVSEAFRSSPSNDDVAPLLMSLTNSADEGIRWGVAAEVPNWWKRVPDFDAGAGVLLKLVSDRHPWVVREALHQVAMDPMLGRSIGVARLTRLANESVTRAAGEGWDTGELFVGARRVAALALP